MKKLALLFLAFCIASASMAQVTTSTMSGKVTDQGGQSLVGATVVAVHTPSGTQYGTVVDGNGNYRILNMRPGGPYTVTVQILGYQTTEYPGIELALGDNYVLNSSLAEAALGMDEIVVRGIGRESNMNTDRAGAITTVNAQKIAMQPTVSRSLNDILKLSPQSATTSNGLAIGGGNYRSSYVTVDGAAFNNAFGIGSNLPAGGSPISLDAIDQMSVSVTPYDVRQSGFTGGAINAVTRSGDNEFRGSAYWYHNNEKYKGDKVKNEKFDKSEQSYNLYGVRLGGPIVKDKLFFFVNAEIERETSPGPTTRARTSTGDKYAGETNYNRPLASDLDNIRNYLINTYGYDPGAYEGYSSKTPSHKILARIDWNISDNHKLNLRYSTTHNKYSTNPSNSVNPAGNGMYPNNSNQGINSRTGTDAIFFQGSRYWQEQNFHSFAGELNSTFGKFANTLRVTYSHQDEPRSWDGQAFPTVDILSDMGHSGNYTPYTTFGLDPFTYGNLRDVKTFIITDELSWSRDKHNFTGGIQYEFDRTKNGYMQQGMGWYVYETWDDFVNGNKPISFSISHPNNKDLKQTYPSFDYEQISLYFQDKIDFSDRFKFTWGVRAELPTYPALKDNFNPAFADLDFGYYRFSTDQMPKSRVQWSPRVGFNWDITGDRRHVLRGGSGIFTGRLPFVWIVSAVGNSNVSQTTYSSTVSETAGGRYVPDFHTDLNDILEDLYGGTFQTTSPVAPTTPTIMDEHLKMPATLKSSLAYDVVLPGGILGSLEGIFNKDLVSVFIKNYGLTDPKHTIQLSENDTRIHYGGSNADRYYNGNIRPYVIENVDKHGWYYSLTARLEKNFIYGLSVMASYTYSDSRTLGDGIGDQVSSAWSTNLNSVNSTNDYKLSWGSYVSPHRLLVSIGYRKEYARSMASSVALFYEGMNLGYASGSSYSYTRYSYTYNTNVVNDGGANSLLYVPATWDELNKMTFTDYTYKENDKDITYTAAQQKEDYWAFINSDKYLKSRKGKYTERNGASMPWRSRFDFKFMQDFYVKTRDGKKNTLQAGIDITNVANLLNRKWGNVKQVNNSSPLLVDINHNTQTVNYYQFQRSGSSTLTKTFNPYARYASTYSMQLSVRYIFN